MEISDADSPKPAESAVSTSKELAQQPASVIRRDVFSSALEAKSKNLVAPFDFSEEITEYEYKHCQTKPDENYYASGYDPLLEYQWYLDFANVKQAWVLSENKGEGAEIAIVDGGVQLDHEDLAANVIPGAGVNVRVGTNNFYRDYPYPFSCKDDKHGTAVAGIAAAVGDNGRGIKGVAPKAKIWASNLVANSAISRDAVWRTYSNRVPQTAVSSNSWTSASPDLLVKADPNFYGLLNIGVNEGFGGKGTSYVFASGNSDAKGDMASYWEVLNHRAVIAVCAVAANSRLASFSETGANLWVCAPSSSGGAFQDFSGSPYTDVNPQHLKGFGLATLDISGLPGYNNHTASDYWLFTPKQLGGRCFFSELPLQQYSPYKVQFASPGTEAMHSEACNEGKDSTKVPFAWPKGATNSYHRFFGGTSAAAPIISGVIALIRADFPHLSWRDIKLILAESSKMPEFAAAESQIGALGYHYRNRYYHHHTKYGFGIIDAAEAMILASEWDNLVPKERYFSAPRRDRFTSGAYIDVPADTNITFIEHVNLVIEENDYEMANELSIKLISPGRVQSVFMEPSECPEKKGECQGFKKGFTFGSAAHLGENPSGTWQLEVTKDGLVVDDLEWRLVFYGHKRS